VIRAPFLTRSIGSVFSSSTEPARYWRVQNNRIHVAGTFEMTQLSCPLTGLRFLIIEDEMSQALLLAELLKDMGGSVSEMAFGIEQAREVVRKDSFDCALLDVNLNGTLSFPIAETMRMQGTPLCSALDMPPALMSIRKQPEYRSSISRCRRKNFAMRFSWP
jgi:CheY-like chemotaxis protein